MYQLPLSLDDTFTKDLPADPQRDNSRRQVTGACFSYVSPRKASDPKLLHASPVMAKGLGLSRIDIQHPHFLETFAGNRNLPQSNPYAMCYGGHQFGNWAGQLGDGRAINLGEVVHQGQRWALQLKGAGETPYSRTADGLAVLRSSLREYLCSEAMFHLGVPTTRALSLALTGDKVLRDILYDGHPEYEAGAVVCRVAPSFVRFGNFEILAAREDHNTLKALADYTIRHFYPEIKPEKGNPYVALFQQVAQRTLDMVVHWQRVGFVHGVMNTDNMSILGLTIDYGPYGWLEGYDPGWTPNTTDAAHKRYRYGTQPQIALWNLLQLANALYPLVGEAVPLEAVLQDYQTELPKRLLAMMRNKLGLQKDLPEDSGLVNKLEDTLQLTETDMTLFFRLLSQFTGEPDSSPGISVVGEAFYDSAAVSGNIQEAWETWFQAYAARLQQESQSAEERVAGMHATNPKYVLRNYMAQLAIDGLEENGDNSVLEELYQVLQDPYAEQPKHQKWFAKRPEWARHKVGCSMLSCSS